VNNSRTQEKTYSIELSLAKEFCRAFCDQFTIYNWNKDAGPKETAICYIHARLIEDAAVNLA